VSNARRYLLLVNPRAAGTQPRGLARVLEGPHGIGRRATVATVASVREARAALADVDLETVPVITGGDGTANLVVQALRLAGWGTRPVGLLPLGTGNALAYSLGLGSLSRALEVLESGVPRALDLMATDHPACPIVLLSISAGFEAAFMGHYTRGRRRPWLGLLPAASATGGRRYRGIRLEADGESLIGCGEPVYAAGLYNLVCYGFGRAVLPEANLSDGWGEAVVHRSPVSYWRSLLGLGGTSPARRWRVARIGADLFQADGELLAGGDVVLTIEPQAYSLLTSRGPDA
jgi:diacylglycerol kinase family enzyme